MDRSNGIIQLPPNCHLPTLDMYFSMATPFANRDDAQFNKMGAVTAGRDTLFTPVQVSETHYAFVPGPEFCPRLYRGQHTDYGTCKSGLYRGNIKYGDLIYWKLKQIDLLSLLERHPAVLEMSRYWTIGKLRLQISLNAIAQHYGYRTDIIDLTRSRNVAMFFATHRFINGLWVPAIGQDAVLYTVNISTLFKYRRGLFPIGINPLPRPYAQRAFGLQLDIHDDLPKLPGVTSENFSVTKGIADTALEKVGGITGLFPSDPFEAIIDEQQAQRYIHQESISRAYIMKEMPGQISYAEIERHLSEANYRINEAPIKLPDIDQLKATQESWDALRQKFCQHIKTRVTADHINTGRIAY